MSYVGKVKIGSNGTPVLIGATLYGTCSDTAATVAKTASVNGLDTLFNGLSVAVRFANANTATNPTLNVNGTGAKAIKTSNSGRPGNTAATSWDAGAVIVFVYYQDGNAWIMAGSSTSAISSLQSSITSEVSRATGAENTINSTITNKCRVKKGTISMPASSWSGSGPYTQTVTVSGATVTANSIVDLQPNAATFTHMYTVGVAAIFVTNNSGTLTATAVAKKPTSNLSIQCTVTEVV